MSLRLLAGAANANGSPLTARHGAALVRPPRPCLPPVDAVLPVAASDTRVGRPSAASLSRQPPSPDHPPSPSTRRCRRRASIPPPPPLPPLSPSRSERPPTGRAHRPPPPPPSSRPRPPPARPPWTPPARRRRLPTRPSPSSCRTLSCRRRPRLTSSRRTPRSTSRPSLLCVPGLLVSPPAPASDAFLCCQPRPFLSQSEPLTPCCLSSSSWSASPRPPRHPLSLARPSRAPIGRLRWLGLHGSRRAQAPPTTAPSPLAQPTTTTPLPQDDLPKVALNVLVISGQRKTFRFDAEMTVGRVKSVCSPGRLCPLELAARRRLGSPYRPCPSRRTLTNVSLSLFASQGVDLEQLACRCAVPSSELSPSWAWRAAR